ncbi:MAG: TraR/DksA C4-type zinc finger protein [Bryobacteraceae bacterium]
MTQNEMNKYMSILQGKVMELAWSTRRRDGIVIEMTADRLDRQVGATDREFAVRKLESESTQLREMKSALRRIEEGTYGICAECEEPIGAKRLAAMPAAVLCIRCQREEDCRCAAQNVRVVLAMAA